VNTYTFEYVHKILHETLQIEVNGVDREEARDEAMKQVFDVALDCEIELVHVDEMEVSDISEEDESYIDYLNSGNGRN